MWDHPGSFPQQLPKEMWDAGVGGSSQNHILPQTGISGTLQCYPLLSQLHDLETLGRAWSERNGAAVPKLAEAAASLEQESKERCRQVQPVMASCFPDDSRSQLLPNGCKPKKSLLSWIHHTRRLAGQLAAQSSFIASCTMSCVNKVAVCSE